MLGWLLLGAGSAEPAEAGAGAAFKSRPSPINDGRLFDLGVSDYDRDGNFELFSTNHKFLGTFAEGRPGSWRDLMGPARLSSSPDYPGFEDLLHPPKPDRPGLYIYAESRTDDEGDDAEDAPLVHIVAKDVQGIPLLPEEARGTVRLPSPDITVVRKDGARVGVRRENGRTVVNFAVAEQGHIVLKVRKVDLPPIEFQIDQAPLAARTFIGANKVLALANKFTLRLIDRHGIAWLDSNSDRRTDAYIVRGGLGGGIKDFPDLLEDELQIANPLSGLFENRIGASKIRKGKCRARQTEALDYDADGILDLFSSCKRSNPKLYRGMGDGTYRGVSRPLQKVGSAGSYYRWADLFGDQRPELVVVNKRRFKILSSRGIGRWKVSQRASGLNGNRLVDSISIGDFDRDGDADLFSGSRSGNTLFVNQRRRRLRAVAPSRLGLPGRGSGASWVDYNNDGRLDLHSLPRGLFRQGADGRFRRTGAVRAPLGILWGITNWFDFDNDGDRDLATAIRTTTKSPRVKARVYENVGAGRRHWLELDLQGPAGNSEAIGSRVRVSSAGRKQTSWVGASDGSRFSRGQYRLYFGLNKARKAKKVTIRWQGGGRTTLRNVAADQLLRVSKG